MSICLRYANTDDDAMEIANDGFLKIFKELSSFVARYDDMEASLKGWMKRIMVNTAIDHYRKNQKHQYFSKKTTKVSFETHHRPKEIQKAENPTKKRMKH